MKMLITGATIALSMLIGTSAFAAKPASGADYGALRDAIENVDGYLESLGASYESLGDLLSEAILDPARGGFLIALLNQEYNEPGSLAGQGFPPTLSGYTAPFTSAKQVISTTAGLGLTPFLIEQIND